MQFLILPNLNKRNAEICTRQVMQELDTLGCQSLLEEDLRGVFSHTSAQFGPSQELLHGCDMIITIGGDGTIIHASMRAITADKPVLGINTGRLGFLAQLESSQLGELRELVQGNYTIQERMLLQGEIYRDGTLHHVCQALNDVVISRMDLGKMLDIDISCNGKPFTSYRADGVIFSTPTGSTAYSLSAGGSVVDPSIASILMTPICPHSLFDRAIVLSPDKELTVRTCEVNNPSEASIAVDGAVVGGLCDRDWVCIKRADVSVKFVTLPSTVDFYEVLTQKMTQRNF